MKVLSWLILAALSIATCQADMQAVEALFRSILSQHEESHIPGPENIAGPITSNNVLRDATVEQLGTVLSLAGMCLDSPNPIVREDGMLLVSTVAVARLDNADLLAPYFQKIASFLTDSEVGMKQAAILALSSGFPRPAPKAVVFLAAHLNDEQNSGTQFIMISGALLVASPSDPNVVRTVLGALERRPDHEALNGAMIQSLGQQKVATDDALRFIRNGLGDKSAAVRRTAVEAVGNLPKDIRSGFAVDLQRVLANPDEMPEVRTRASEVLMQ